MPDDEQSAEDAEDAAPEDESEPERVTPEVVGATPTVPPGPTERVALYRMVRIGFTLLIAIGALVAIAGFRLISDPEDFVCESARTQIDNELDEDEPNPAVAGIDPDDVDDLPCAEAEAIAAEFEDVATEDTARSFGTGALIAGSLMIASGAYALVVRTRRGRNIALAIAAIGIIPSTLFGLGLIGLFVMGFVVYAIGFSRDAKAAFGVVGGARAAGGGGLFRPRVPPPSE